MPTSVEDVKRLMENTGDTIGGYLPQSVTAYLPHHTTTDNPLDCEPKSQDVHSASLNEGGAHPETSQNEHPESSDGAGILPGPADEFGVAIPPDERISSQENTINSETHSETAIPTLPEDQRQQVLNDASPLMTENASPGVKEVGMAPLPEEKKSVGASRDTPLATGPASVAPVPTVSDENTTASSTYASHPIIPNTTAREYPLASNGARFKGVPLSKGFQQELLDQEQSSPTENSIGERRNMEQSPSDVATTGHGAEAAAGAVTDRSSSHAEHETSVRKKLGFMTKLKEEMKGIPIKLHIKREKDFVGDASS